MRTAKLNYIFRKIIFLMVMVLFFSCATSRLIMLYKKPGFNYTMLTQNKIYIVPVINFTNDNELNNAEILFIEQVGSRFKNFKLVPPLETFKLINEQGLHEDYNQLKKKFINNHEIKKNHFSSLHRALGDCYIAFIKIMAFSERREIDHSCLFPGTFKEERAIKASLSGSVTVFDVKRGEKVFDTLQRVNYIYNRGGTDSAYVIATDRKSIATLCLSRFFSDIIEHFPRIDEKDKKIELVPEWSVYGWQVSAECLSGSCIDGQGVLLFDNGDRYKGTFVKGKRHGNGEYVWNNGNIYKGNWKDDKKHGEGLLLDRSGKLINKGVWIDDLLKK